MQAFGFRPREFLILFLIMTKKNIYTVLKSINRATRAKESTITATAQAYHSYCSSYSLSGGCSLAKMAQASPYYMLAVRRYAPSDFVRAYKELMLGKKEDFAADVIIHAANYFASMPKVEDFEKARAMACDVWTTFAEDYGGEDYLLTLVLNKIHFSSLADDNA